MTTVLVVDDDEDVRRVIIRILSGAGFEVLEADDALEAMATLRSGASVDVLLTDLEMPGLAGAALVSQARTLDPHLPILVLSGRADPIVTTAELGVGCIAKPFKSDDLVDAIELAHAAGRQSRSDCAPPGRSRGQRQVN
jgi:CheY-like chemotaxis protein